MSAFARGLNNFISDIRACTSKEAERNRVERELGNIRAKLSRTANLTSYQRKKYAWKLCLIHMLGYQLDFGHMEVINLLSSTKFSEKNVGYVCVALLLKATDPMMTLAVNSMRNDLLSPVSSSQTLALSAIANIGGTELGATLTGDVERLLLAADTAPVARKKAALTLLRIFRDNPDALVLSEWPERMVQLLDDRHLGVITSVLSLLLGLVSHDATGFDVVRPHLILILSRLVMVKSSCTPDYLYYASPSPFLQVKLLRALQYFPPPQDSTNQSRLSETLRKLLTRTEITKSVNKNNADHAVLFEAINLIISQGAEAEPRQRNHAVKLVGKFVSVREPNIRYLGLETMCRLVYLDDMADVVRKHQSTVLYALKDADVSVRKRALDLLFAMCNQGNATEIISELLNYLTRGDTAIREELVLKTAVLAERWSQDLRFYVDTILRLITLAGGFVGDDIWHRLVQMITDHEELQPYATTTLFNALEPQRVEETVVNVGGYCLGEFGFLIADQEGMGALAQCEVLVRHFAASSPATRALLLSAFVKMVNLYPDNAEVRALVTPILERHRSVVDAELQQRAVEYFALQSNSAVMRDVLEAMPPFPEGRESSLEARLREAAEAGSDRPVWSGGDGRPRRSSSASAPEGGDGGDGESADEPAAEAAPTDLLDLDAGDVQPPAAPAATAAAEGETVGIDPALTPQMRSWFNALVTTQQGVLFQNDLIQIGVRHEYRGFNGRISLFLTAAQGTALEALRVDVPTPEYLQLQVGEAPARLDAGGQGRVDIAAACMQPYAEAPEFTVAFQARGASHLYPLRLPIVASCFLEAVPMQANDYVARWGALEGQNREQQEVFTADGVDVDKARRLLTEQLKIGHAQGVDAPDAAVPSVSGVCTLRTGFKGADGKTLSVGALVRLECNAQARAYRLTVRAQHATVSVALKNIIKAQLMQLS